MVDGIDGDSGIPGNIKSASYGFCWPLKRSNPPSPPVDFSTTYNRLTAFVVGYGTTKHGGQSVSPPAGEAKLAPPPASIQRILRAETGWKRCECPIVVSSTLNKRLLRASAFLRAAIGRDLAGRDNGVDAAEQRIAASLDRMVGEIRNLRLGQQALSAFVDVLAKTLLTRVPEPPRDAHDQAVACGKAAMTAV
jgi:hypothetical protein